MRDVSSVGDRNALVEAHSELVKEIARAIHRKLPRVFDLSDLIQAGAMGLIKAAEDWNPSRGVPFSAFARLKIRGAILDWVRKNYREANRGALPGPVAVPSLDMDLDHEIDRKKIVGAVRHLEGRDREVLRLRYAEGLSLQAVGDCLSVSKKRAIELHNRALERLRGVLSRAA